MAASTSDRETFLTRLRESGLLAPEDMTRAFDLAATTDRGKVLARLLVENKLLTRFQAEMILSGRTDGFTLGQYRILDELGRGGMGRVFKAEHQTMNRIVALKVLTANLTKTERARQLFQREVRAAAKLIHPNIVTAYDANQVNDRHYLVMEFVDGPNLYDLVKERGPLPVAQACEFIRQAALGLQYAHEKGMVHRDIKPSNLLVHHVPGQGSVVKILDFGLARLQEPNTPANNHDSIPAEEQQVMGTPDYLSPEQARNLHAADGRSDLYSLGCTFYFLLTGSVPFSGGTALEKLVRHGSDEATPVHMKRPEVPLEISAVVAKLMAKKPDDRYQTPAELASALTPYSFDQAGPLPTAAVNATQEAGSGDSPWANIFEDDAAAQISTIPPDHSATPLKSAVRLKRVPPMPPAARPTRLSWLRIVIIAAALGLGFLLGAATLLLLVK